MKNQSKITHGMSKSSEYRSWCGMKERCFNPNAKKYATYGAVGITLEKAWNISFQAFIDYIGLKPKDGLKYSIDRIDNDGGYVVGNVRWATDKLQSRNKGMQINNTSGKKGVGWQIRPDGSLSAKAVWRNVNGYQETKFFSVKVFGLMPAFAEACCYRDKMIAQMNLDGAGYSASHIQ